MIFSKTGRVSKRLYVTGLPWSPVYLLAGDQSALFEAGFHCMGRFYERDIRDVLDCRQPKILFLTHVHYDHCGASAYLKGAFPAMKIAASPKADAIMKRPNALSLMGKLSKNMIPLVKDIEGIDNSLLIEEPFEPFTIELILEEGQIISLGENTSVQVISTPGHTQDLFSYYIPEEKILFATEAAGVLNHSGNIMTEFIVDYGSYMDSLRHLAALDVEILCQGHHFVFTGDEVREFFHRSIETAESFRAEVEQLLHAENGSIDRVVTLIKAKEYDMKPGPKQPEGAYMLNLRNQIANLAETIYSRKGVQVSQE